MPWPCHSERNSAKQWNGMLRSVVWAGWSGLPPLPGDYRANLVPYVQLDQRFGDALRESGQWDVAETGHSPLIVCSHLDSCCFLTISSDVLATGRNHKRPNKYLGARIISPMSRDRSSPLKSGSKHCVTDVDACMYLAQQPAKRFPPSVWPVTSCRGVRELHGVV